MNNEKRPRDWAADLIDAWIRREESIKILNSIPDKIKTMAATEARNCCNLTKYWAQRAYREGMDIVPKRMKNLVIKYWQYRK